MSLNISAATVEQTEANEDVARNMERIPSSSKATWKRPSRPPGPPMNASTPQAS